MSLLNLSKNNNDNDNNNITISNHIHSNNNEYNIYEDYPEMLLGRKIIQKL